MKKQHVTYAEFLAHQTAKRTPGTLAFLISRFIVEMNGLDGKPPVHTLGKQHEYNLRRVQRTPLGAVIASQFTKKHFIDYCRERIATVCAATNNQDVSVVSGVLKYAGSAWDDCADVTDAAVRAAKPFLVKNGYIAKSTPRERRPTDEEIATLLAYFAIQNARSRNKIDMVKMTNWQLKSGRRISESCRALWADWDRETHTMVVRKMKDPKNRNKTKRVALPDGAQAMLVAMWETRDPNEPRMFPYIAQSVGSKYTRAKKVLGIKGLRLHDSRRECGTRLIEVEGYSSEEAILVTGHDSTKEFERTYRKMNPALFHLGPIAKRIADAARVTA